MQKIFMPVFAVAMVCLGVFSCKKTINPPEAETNNQRLIQQTTAEECIPGPYPVQLILVTYNGAGQWTWLWKIDGTGTGNGIDAGTRQALSHVDLLLPVCVAPEILVSASWKYEGDVSFTSVSSIPVVDPAITNTCSEVVTPPSIKFEIGNGVGYFQLVVNKYYQKGFGMNALYKSGSNTGCGLFCFEGISCIPSEELPSCSFSQGFWFAKPLSEANDWPIGGISMGGKLYTAAEGRSLWWVNGNIELKRAFTQAATIKLSIMSGYLSNASATAAYVSSIDNVLNGLPKLTPANLVSVNQSLSATTRKNLGVWAGAIGTWIDANHCERREVPY